jgi:hypothetical protein
MTDEEMLNLRVATKEDSGKFFHFFKQYENMVIVVKHVSLSGLSARNLKNLVLIVAKTEGITKERVLHVIKAVLGSKNPHYPDDSYTLKQFDELAKKLEELFNGKVEAKEKALAKLYDIEA